MTQPFISIVIPVYNVADYVEKCLQSVMAQTYTGLIECLIVDDCGKDESIAICESLISQYNGPIRFRILHHEKNQGLSAARNTGIRSSNGEFIFFLDSDDYITPDCIELLTALAIKYPEVDIVQGLLCMDNERSRWFDYRKHKVPEYTFDKSWISDNMFNSIPRMAWNRLIRRTLILQYNLYFAEGLIHEDEHWNLISFSYIRSMAFCFRGTYHYVSRDDSIMAHSVADVKFKALIKVCDDIIVRGLLKCTLSSVMCVFDFLGCYIPQNNVSAEIRTLRYEVLKRIVRNTSIDLRMRIYARLNMHEPLLSSSLRIRILKALYFRDWIRGKMRSKLLALQ